MSQCLRSTSGLSGVCCPPTLSPTTRWVDCAIMRVDVYLLGWMDGWMDNNGVEFLKRNC